MNISIKKVIDFGHNTERIEFLILSNCNISYYLVSDTTFVTPDKISNKLRHIYWFPSKDVKRGDEIVLYTKKGINKSESINSGQNTRYIFYWGLESFVWNNSGDSAVLFELNTWKTTKIIN
ncbi:hypothetical protein SAMN05421841_1962 [Chryseobacterium wanjuense]|uniref:Uncharacterized protein n=1 Tax=Chryseobacterium wanjuense TaxID=356305 RepID=A0A1I0QJT1_9FLAO|nr:hypothetical protein [Chryseobacterium wanjuense]SEW27403.1 hypothetical protein SAMN05421841_1962 [Chryseobacterium wanjuense]